MKRWVLFAMVVLAIACTKKEKSGERKVFNYPLSADVKGLDPTLVNDVYGHVALDLVYQGLLQYNYYKRPYEIEPCLAASMPKVSDDGLTFTFTLRKGVFFHDDPAFAGKKRELTAHDVVYSFKRLADPHVKSPNWWMVSDKIVGLNEWREKIRSLKPPVDYDKYPVAGLTAPNDSTFVMKLTSPSRQLFYVMTMPPMAMIPREAVEKYGDEFLNHPVGTGPFILKDWRRGQKLHFIRNPTYWDDVDSKTGNKLPVVDEVALWVYVEGTPQWLNFLRGKLDMTGIPKDYYDLVITPDRDLTQDMKKKKITLRITEPTDIVFYAFNMSDPVVGKNKYLRQAISAAINREEKIKIFYNNRAVEAHGLIPPGMFGHDEKLRNPYRYNLPLAKELMKKATAEHERLTGEKKIPPLTYDITNSTTARQLGEAQTYDLAQIGLKVNLHINNWPQFQEQMAKGRAQFFGYGWTADYPDAENFTQLLYSKNVSPGPNRSNFKNAEYDRLYEKMRDMPDTAERKKTIVRMSQIAQEEVPWVLFAHRIGFSLQHGWMKNVERNSFNPGNFLHLDIDSATKREILPVLK